MCDYCNNINSLVAKVPVVECDVNMGDIGKANLGVYIKHSNYGSFLDLNLNNYGLGGKTVHRSRQVYYCPMCGRRFEED